MMSETCSVKLELGSRSAWIGSTGGLGGGCGDGVAGSIAEGEKDRFGAFGLITVQLLERGPKGGHAEVFGTIGPLDAVHEGGEVDEFAACVHEVEIEDLEFGHNNESLTTGDTDNTAF